MSDYIQSKKAEFDQAISHFQKEISALRTGRATPALVENIFVEAYGTKTSLQGLASATVSDPKTLVIEPWDKSILKDIEKAIFAANIGVSPVVDGNIVRLSLPVMTEETRNGLVKQLKERAESARVAIRGIREKIRQETGAKEKAKAISEDEKFSYQEELDKLTKEYGGKIDEIVKKKETEITEI